MKYFLLVLSMFFILDTHASEKLDIKDNYSPRNKHRNVRLETSSIILHTTESGNRSAINSLKKYGTANYVVLTNGQVQRIIHRNKVAYHAGRSMWNGRTDVSKTSIGIEVVGYHNKPITNKQIVALRELLNQLQRIYNIPDTHVLTHSMVAYGRPNHWHKHKHRGRKRCGMQFANKKLRMKIGLNNTFHSDPDVESGRLVVADQFLFDALYIQKPIVQEHNNTITEKFSAWYIARDRYDDEYTFYTFPNGQVYKGSEIENWSEIPINTRVSYGKSAAHFKEKVRVQEISDQYPSAWSIAGSDYNLNTTIYFLSNGQVRCGDELPEQYLKHLSPGTKILVGYVYGGHISKERTAYDIAKQNWNDRHTIYRFPDGTIHQGDTIQDKSIPEKTLILFQR